MQEMDVLLGKEVQISVNPEIQITSEIVRSRFSPEERGCYFDGELELRYLEGYRYSLANCLYSSIVERVIERCHCVPHLLPLNTSHHLPVCEETSLLCMNNVLRLRGETRLCKTACEDQVLNTEFTSSTFPNKANFRKRDEQCLLLMKLRMMCSDSRRFTLARAYPGICTNVSQTYYGRCGPDGQIFPYSQSGLTTRAEVLLEHLLFRYARENLVILNIYIKVSQVGDVFRSGNFQFQDPFVTRLLRDQKVSRIEFVANTGGLLGLCTGFSFVTFCEIIYQVSHSDSQGLTVQCFSQVSKWIQRYVRQLQRKALVYKQSFRGSIRRQRKRRENTEELKLEDVSSLGDSTRRQRSLAFKDSLMECNDSEKYYQGMYSLCYFFSQSLIKTIFSL